MAIRVPPTPWAVVPPGTGILNIIIVKLNAEKIASSGTVRLFSTFCTLLTATAQAGTVTTPVPSEKMGLRYPSGICTTLLLTAAVEGLPLQNPRTQLPLPTASYPLSITPYATSCKNNTPQVTCWILTIMRYPTILSLPGR